MKQADFVELECEDCHDSLLDLDEKRRTRCKRCGLLVCRWCYHHVHNLPGPCIKERPAPRANARRTSEYWKAEHLAANKEVGQLRQALEIAKEFIENQQLADAEWSRVLDVCAKNLRQG